MKKLELQDHLYLSMIPLLHYITDYHKHFKKYSVMLFEATLTLHFLSSIRNSIAHTQTVALLMTLLLLNRGT